MLLSFPSLRLSPRICSRAAQLVKTLNKHGHPYSPKPLYQLLTGLHLHALASHPQFPGQEQSHFSHTTQRYGQSLQSTEKRKGWKCLQAHWSNNQEEENMLWESGILGLATSPKALLRAVFFYIGKKLCLWAGAGYQCLIVSQFTRCSERARPSLHLHRELFKESSGRVELRIKMFPYSSACLQEIVAMSICWTLA